MDSYVIISVIKNKYTCNKCGERIFYFDIINDKKKQFILACGIRIEGNNKYYHLHEQCSPIPIGRIINF